MQNETSIVRKDNIPIGVHLQPATDTDFAYPKLKAFTTAYAKPPVVVCHAPLVPGRVISEKRFSKHIRAPSQPRRQRPIHLAGYPLPWPRRPVYLVRDAFEDGRVVLSC